jgi:signal transduction histidine kinase
MIPQLQAPPRVRVEWLIAGARVLLAAGALLALAIDPVLVSPGPAYLLGWYLVYSLALLALVWTPIRFAPGWAIVVHVVDVACFAMWCVQPAGVPNPSVVFYAFVVVCATLRWQMAGTIWTSLLALAVHGAAWAFAPGSFATADDFASRTVHLLLIGALVGFLGTHHYRFQYEISRLASWPRRPMQDRRALLAEILRQSSEFLRAPRTVLVWEEPGEGWVNVAWQSPDGLEWTQEAEAAYGSFVLPGLEQTSFQVSDAEDDHGRVLLLRSSGFRRRRCGPVHETLRARFEMHAVQSWPLSGELIRGRMFCLDKRRMRLDDLVLGEVVASLAVSRLESHYWQERLREAAAVEERVRLARDVHDHLVQAQAGTALQLLAARRLLNRDPSAGRERLADLQDQMEHDELEMRSFVTRLRPPRQAVTPASVGLTQRLEDLRRRVERQWQINVRLRLDDTDGLPDEVVEGTYRLVQESIVNAARHADASSVDVTLTRSDDEIRLKVVDDGQGFGFQGTYDLAALNGMNAGPLTLRERVADLGGDLRLTSSDTGAELVMALPLARVHV